LQELVRELRALQAQEGWLRPESLRALAERLRIPLHRIESVSTFYTHFRREPPQGAEIEVCRDLACRLAGAGPASEALREWAGRRGDAVVREVSCLGRCDRAPAAAFGHAVVDPRDPDSWASRLEHGDQEPVSRPVRSWPSADPYVDSEVGREVGSEVGSESLAPWSVIRAALGRPTERVTERLERAGLRGMGGAGFPTARKWSLVAAESGGPKHVVCNADESEPASFKDRELLHDLPHLVIEGMLLAAYCIGAERGTIFIRHEYEPERRRLEAAIEAARAAGALGDGIFGSSFSFDLDVFVSPGGYILGEETALLECLEGRRGEPRNKPPFPGTKGLLGRPTLINNVETLVHAVGIAHRGEGWWADLGREGFRGQKFVSVCGDVERPGVELFAVGTPLGEVLERHDGMKQGAALLAVAPGGASSSFLGPEALDVPLDFDALARAGSMLGAGAVLFVAEGRDLLEVGLDVTRFFRNESCGKCVPCRLGCEKAVALVEKAGCISAADEMLLRSLHATMGQTSICGLGQVALGPLLSILDRFPDRVRRAPGT
jgi:NADH:ubiquinone oxidoreductase subunit F (NADH-binding)/NADH:ubiquinone oxidoreductase subunit E